MNFDPTTAKPVRSGFDPSSAKPFTPAKIQKPEPVSGDVPGVVRDVVDYFTEPPNKEDFSALQTAVSGGGGAAIGAAGPSILKTGGKLLSKAPLPYAKPLGAGAQALGEALGKIPLWKRTMGGGSTGAVADVTTQGAEMAGAPRIVSMPLGVVAAGAGPTLAKPLAKVIPGATGRALRGVQTVEEMLAGKEAGKPISVDKQKALDETLNLVRGGEKSLEPELTLQKGLKDRAEKAVAAAQRQAADLEDLASYIVQEAERSGGKITQGMEKRIANLRSQWDAAADKLRKESSNTAREGVEAAAKRATIIKKNAEGKSAEVRQQAEAEANRIIQESRAAADQLLKNSEKQIAEGISRIEHQQSRLRKFTQGAKQTQEQATQAVGERILPTELGKQTRSVFDATLQKIKETREKVTQPLRDAWKNAIQQKEASGVTYKTTQAYNDARTAIQAEKIDPATGLTKISDPKSKSQVDDVLAQLSPTKKVTNEAGEVLEVEAKPSAVLLETLYRRLKDRASGLPAEGVEAIDQQLAGRLAGHVEKILDEFSGNAYIPYKKAYAEASKPLNEFRTNLGRSVTDKPEGFDMGGYLEDLTTFGGKTFAGKPQVQQLLSIAGPEEANRLAKGYLADQIGTVTPNSITSVLEKNRDWLSLPEFSQLKDQLAAAAKSMSKVADQTQRAGILEKALNVRMEKLPGLPSKEAGRIEQQGASAANKVQTQAERDLQKIEQDKADKLKRFGTPSTEDLRKEAESQVSAGATRVESQAGDLRKQAELEAKARLEQAKGEAAPLKAEAAEVVKKAEQLKKDLLAGTTEESRLRQIFFGSNEAEWNALADMVKSDPKMKDAMGQAIGQLIATQPRMAERTFQDISQRLTSRGLATQAQMQEIEAKLRDVLVSPVTPQSKIGILGNMFKRVLNASGGVVAGQTYEAVVPE
jgi:hypothetical protein